MNLNIILIEILPLFLMGFFCGFVRFARGENELLTDDKKDNEQTFKRARIWRAVDVILTSAITSLIIFALLSHFTELVYLVKIAISAAVALYGVDKIIDILSKLISLKKGGG